MIFCRARVEIPFNQRYNTVSAGWGRPTRAARKNPRALHVGGHGSQGRRQGERPAGQGGRRPGLRGGARQAGVARRPGSLHRPEPTAGVFSLFFSFFIFLKTTRQPGRM